MKRKNAIWTTNKRKSTCKICFNDMVVFPHQIELTKFTLVLNSEQDLQHLSSTPLEVNSPHLKQNSN